MRPRPIIPNCIYVSSFQAGTTLPDPKRNPRAGGWRIDNRVTDHHAGTLLSVNVGLAQNVDWHGRTVYTGGWKCPVEGRRAVRRLNIDGDGQGDLRGHGGKQLGCSQPIGELALDL